MTIVSLGGFNKATSTATGKLSSTPKMPSGTTTSGGSPTVSSQLQTYGTAPEPYFVGGRWVQEGLLRKEYGIPPNQEFEVKQGQVYISGTRALTTEEIKLQQDVRADVEKAKVERLERQRMGIAVQAKILPKITAPIYRGVYEQIQEKKQKEAASKMVGTVEIVKPQIGTKAREQYNIQQKEIIESTSRVPDYIRDKIWRAQEGYGLRGVSDVLKNVYPTREQYLWAVEDPSFIKQEVLKQSLKPYSFFEDYKQLQFEKKQKEAELYGTDIKYPLWKKKEFEIPTAKTSKFLYEKVFTSVHSESDWIGKSLKYKSGELLLTAGTTAALSAAYAGVKLIPKFTTSASVFKASILTKDIMKYGFYGAGAIYAGTKGAQIYFAPERKRGEIVGSTIVESGAMGIGAYAGAKAVSKGYKTFLSQEIPSYLKDIGFKGKVEIKEPFEVGYKNDKIIYNLYNELNLQLTKQPTVLFGKSIGKSKGQVYSQVSVGVGDNLYTTTQIGKEVIVSKTLPTGEVTGRVSYSNFPLYQSQVFNKIISKIPALKDISYNLINPFKPLTKTPLLYRMGFGREYTKFKDISKTIPLTKGGELEISGDLKTIYAAKGDSKGKSYVEWMQNFKQTLTGKIVKEGFFKREIETVDVLSELKAEGTKTASQKRFDKAMKYKSGEMVIPEPKYIPPKFVKHSVDVQKDIVKLTGTKEEIAELRKQQLEIFKQFPFGHKPLFFKRVDEGVTGFEREIQSRSRGNLFISPELKIKRNVKSEWKTPSEIFKIDWLKEKIDLLKEKKAKKERLKELNERMDWSNFKSDINNLRIVLKEKLELLKKKEMESEWKKEALKPSPTISGAVRASSLRKSLEIMQEKYPLVEQEQVYSSGRQQLVLEQPKPQETVRIFEPTIIGTGISKSLAQQIIDSRKTNIYTPQKIFMGVKPKLSFFTDLKRETLLKQKIMTELKSKTKSITDLANKLKTETKTERKLRSLTELKSLTKLDTRLKTRTNIKTDITTPPTEIRKWFFPKIQADISFKKKSKFKKYKFPKFKMQKASEQFFPYSDPISLLKTELRTMKRARQPKITKKSIKEYRKLLTGEKWVMPTL